MGRTDELRQLTTAPAEPRGAVTVGPAGVGKPTRARAWLPWAEDRGVSVAHTTATHASRALPFGAFGSMLPYDLHLSVRTVENRWQRVEGVARGPWTPPPGRCLARPTHHMTLVRCNRSRAKECR
jgi:hypothetical protein